MKKILALDIKYSAIQALYFGSFCALMGYASVYLLNKGFSNSVIGIVLAFISAIAVFAQPTVASFADKNKHIELRKIIAVMLLVIIVLSVSMLFLGKGSIILICAFIGISTCMQTMTPLLNSMAFMFEKHGIAINFGLGRGIGSAAYALVSLALGHLLEMDGFGVNQGIIVMAATNRIDILDPAILRPGRFDRKVVVGRPDVAGRLAILNVHAAKKPLGDDVDLDSLSRTTAGFTGADLENLLNEAAINAAKHGRKFIKNEDVNYAFVKVGIGVEKRSKIISEKEKKITAYHESGHAILFHVLPDVGPVHSVSIIPTGMGAAGYTMPLPEKDEMFNTRGKMLQNIIVSLGGRVAEELVFDDITTGASQDIRQATQTARDMVTKYGFSSKLGLINYDTDNDEVFIGRDLAHTRPYGENIAGQIDAEVKNIIDECYSRAKTIISENRDILDKSASLLLEKEKISREEFEALFEEENKEN